MSDVARVTHGERRRRRVIASLTALGGIAAILVLVALPQGAAAPPPTTSPAERAGDASGPPAIRPWSGTSTSALAWSPVAAGAQYRVTLTDAVGDEMWSASTADTLLALPDSLALAAGRDYFWVVDALLPDGTTATSGSQRLAR